MDLAKFEKNIEKLMLDTALIQIRIAELREFECQWTGIFQGLIPEFGDDVKIHVANQRLLQSFQYDKYHIVCDDLVSLIQNEIVSEFSVSKTAPQYLSIKSLEEYVKMEHEI